MSERPLNYSTTVPAKRTIGECQDLLAQAGASAVAVMYRYKKPVGLSFRLDGPHGEQHFQMPVNYEGVAAQLQKIDAAGAWPASLRKSNPKLISKYLTEEHAIAVAWRVVKDWLEAQLAIIAAEMVTLDQVMLPYLAVAEGETLYDRYLAANSPALAVER